MGLYRVVELVMHRVASQRIQDLVRCRRRFTARLWRQRHYLIITFRTSWRNEIWCIAGAGNWMVMHFGRSRVTMCWSRRTKSFDGRDEVQQVGVVSVLSRRLAVVETPVFVIGRVEPLEQAVSESDDWRW